ncbi:MAG TPA: phosphatidylglycerophosphatase A [Terriglobales bacterium]|nr:phosphatidylglycerophosphatase A [Terriglobales bacterium]
MPALAQQAAKKTIWAWACGSFLGIGLIGKGGGTVASVATVALWLLAATRLTGSSLVYAVITAAVLSTLLGIYVADVMAHELRKKDPSEVVIDEVAGQLIALIAVPVNWKYALASLILFRAFDIVKPPPVRNLEALPGGLGIMMDDVAAGLYALAIVHGLMWTQLF